MLKKTIVVIALLLAVTGIIFASGIQDRKVVTGALIRACTEQAEGLVIEKKEVRASTRSKEKNAALLTISMTINGTEHKRQLRSTGGLLSQSRKLEAGDKIKIYYNPNNPAQFYIDEQKFDLIMFRIFGLIFLSAGIVISLLEIRKRRVCTENTEGVIIGNEKRHGNKFYPIFSITVNGIEYRQIHNTISKDTPKYKEGDKLTVYYNPNNPKQYHLNEKGLFLFVIIAIIMGIIPLVLSF